MHLGADDLAGLEALGADVGAFHVPVEVDGHLLHVRTIHPIGYTMRVADVASRHGMFTTNCTNLRHLKLPKYLDGCHFTATKSKWWSEGDLNPRHADFQSAALPTELPDHVLQQYQTC